jgi:hypothetical protein
MRCPRILAAVVFLGAPALAVAQQPPVDEGPAPQVKCKDGTLSKVGPGACSDHDGVAPSDAPPTKRTPATVQEDNRVRPQSAAVANPAMVRCKDGTLSDAGSGACSHGGGIDRYSGAAPLPVAGSTTRYTDTEGKVHNPKGELTPNPPAQAPELGKATARCKDGTLSHARYHTDTCADRGGVAGWLDATSDR